MIPEEQVDYALTEAGRAARGWLAVNANSSDPAILAAALNDLRATKRTLTLIERELEVTLDEVIDREEIEPGVEVQRVEVEGFGVVEVKRSPRRTGWDHEAMDRAFLRTFPESMRDVAGAVQNRMRRCFSIGGAKKEFTELTDTSLDEYCEESWRPSVVITTPEKTPRLEGF